MAARIRSDNDLPTLRVQLHTATGGPSGEPLARFEVLRGRGPVTWTATVPTRRLGLADWIRSARDVHENEFAIPDPVADGARAALADLTRPDDPACWLELPPPRGYLHFLPWERLLSPPMDRPLLRLPAYTLRPNAPGSSLRVVLVAGQGGERGAGRRFDVPGMVAELARLWLTSTGHSVTVEVFVAPSDVDGVRERLGGEAAVLVHDPRKVGAILPGVSHNGWVAWVRTGLGGRATDVVHVVTHGTLAGERGALALPSLAPTGDSAPWPGMLDSVDLCTSLNRAGAWGLVVTSPPHSHCPAALRDLADAVAQARPGVVALHELDAPDAGAELQALLRMLVDGSAPGRSLPGVLCCSHPAFVAFPEWDVPLCAQDGTSALIAGTTNEVLAQDDTPAWVAAGARTIEALQARVLPSDGEPPDPSAVAALEAVSRLFEEHVRTFAPPKASGGEATS